MADIEYVVTYTPEDEKGDVAVVALFTTFSDADVFAAAARVKLATSGNWDVEEITD